MDESAHRLQTCRVLGFTVGYVKIRNLFDDSAKSYVQCTVPYGFRLRDRHTVQSQNALQPLTKPTRS